MFHFHIPVELSVHPGCGDADKEIIKVLKKKGYSYPDIEKAMLQAVKEGVEEKPAQPIQYAPQQYQQPYQEQNIFSPSQEEIFDEDMPEQQDTESSIILEEVVEGIVEEKWNKFDKSVESMKNEFAKIRSDMAGMEQRLSSRKEQSRDLSPDVAELSNKLEDLEIRISGLERAFKQFLPSLTSNVQSLSEMIKDMKGHQQQKPDFLKPI